MAQARAGGRWAALVAAFLGWMFDGFEMGLFPVVARPALLDLLGFHEGGTVPENIESQVALWNSLAIAGFLVGAATGGVLFGWLGDRLGRVRAMSLSILTYALCSGLGALTTAPWQIVAVRFAAALGMGGEWALGVALVMEVWQGQSRAILAGLIGAASNIGFALVAYLSLGLSTATGYIQDVLPTTGLPDDWVQHLTAHSSWRLLMVAGMLPAVLTFFIRLFVPESGSWEQEKSKGTTSSWATRDLLGVLVGASACGIILWLWSTNFDWITRLVGTLVCLLVVTGGYLYPIIRYLRRSGSSPKESSFILNRMGLAALLSGIALLGTWGSIQWAPVYADQLSHQEPGAKAYTQIWSAFGAIVACMIAPLICDWCGRKLTYAMLCVAALGATLVFYQTNNEFGAYFLFTVFLAGGLTATFYGWLPLYLPELFPTRVRATGQGFGFNFGRILAAIGALQTGALTKEFQGLQPPEFLPELKGGYALACSVMSLIYLVGMVVIWFAPETKGKPLPE
jgi:SHS family sialic acid transporter-like MFS transporter